MGFKPRSTTQDGVQTMIYHTQDETQTTIYHTQDEAQTTIYHTQDEAQTTIYHTQDGVQTTIYHTQDEHVNHYTTHVVLIYDHDMQDIENVDTPY
jgi:uncharacterized cupredoxin-like copper-binding protein